MTYLRYAFVGLLLIWTGAFCYQSGYNAGQRTVQPVLDRMHATSKRYIEVHDPASDTEVCDFHYVVYGEDCPF